MNNAAMELTFVSYKLSGGTCISTFIFKEKGITPFYSVAYSDQEAFSFLKDLSGSKGSTTCVSIDERNAVKSLRLFFWGGGVGICKHYLQLMVPVLGLVLEVRVR